MWSIQDTLDFLVAEVADANRRCKNSHKQLMEISTELDRKAVRALQRLAKEEQLEQRRKEDNSKKQLLETIFGARVEVRTVDKVPYGKRRRIEGSSNNDDEDADDESPSTSLGTYVSKKRQAETRNLVAGSGRDASKASKYEERANKHGVRSGNDARSSRSEERGRKRVDRSGRDVSKASQRRDKKYRRGETFESKEKRDRGLKRKHSPARGSGSVGKCDSLDTRGTDRSACRKLNEGSGYKNIGHGKTESRGNPGTTVFNYGSGTASRMQGSTSNVRTTGAEENGGGAKTGQSDGQEAGKCRSSKNSYGGNSGRHDVEIELVYIAA